MTVLRQATGNEGVKTFFDTFEHPSVVPLAIPRSEVGACVPGAGANDFCRAPPIACSRANCVTFGGYPSPSDPLKSSAKKGGRALFLLIPQEEDLPPCRVAGLSFVSDFASVGFGIRVGGCLHSAPIARSLSSCWR
ncbi:hypothetical protein CDAR_114371 [Caerostris darwini]|uniref:Uncharacterized protein n=1 Tax=Caerostris darwini TaxID=1538125 RepID=A0AAV4T1X2_9ARAC|nr:hypothetical protein CDAR_114371 [Caerostris darwini]